MYQGSPGDTYLGLSQRRGSDGISSGVRYITDDLIKKVSKQNNVEVITTLNLTLAKEGGKKIRYIEGLERLKKLQSLNLSCNIIEKIERLDKLTKLRELNLSYNLVSKIEGIDMLINLQNLNLTGNQIEHIPQWLGKKLKALRVLRLAKNEIQSLQEFYKLRPLRDLTLLTVAENPVAQLRHCRLFLVFHLRTVDTLDGQSVTLQERNNAHSRFAQEELENLEQLLDQREGAFQHLQDLHNKSLQDMESKERKTLNQGEKLKSQKERLHEMEQELETKNKLLKRKTSELTMACEKHYELEQELAFYKIDHKFESLGKIQTPNGNMNDVKDGLIGESPYIGKGRFKQNQLAHESHLSGSKSNSAISGSVPTHHIDLEAHKKKMSELDQELSGKQNTIEKAQEQLNHLQDELMRTEEQVQLANLELQKMEDLANAQAITADDKQHVRSKLAKRINKIHHLRGEAHNIEQQMSRAQGEIQHQEQGIGQLRGRLRRMGSKDSLYSTVKKEVSDKEQQLSLSLQEYQALQDQLEHMLHTITHETGEVKKLEQDLREGQATANDEIREELEGIIHGLQLYLDDIRVKAETQKDQMSGLLRDREEMMENLHQLEKEKHKLLWAQEELARTQQQLAKLEESLEEERHQNTSLHHQLEETRQRELDDADVADRLHKTEDELEKMRRKVAEAERRAQAEQEAYERELEVQRREVEEAADHTQMEVESKEDQINDLHLKLAELQAANTDLQSQLYRQQQHLKEEERKKVHPEDLQNRLHDILSGVRSGRRGVEPRHKDDQVGHVLADLEDQVQNELDKSFHEVEKARRAAAMAEAEAEALRKQLGHLEAEDVKRRREDRMAQKQMEEDTRDLQVLMAEIARLKQELETVKKSTKIPDRFLEPTTPRSQVSTKSSRSSTSTSSSESSSKASSSFPSSQWSHRRRELYESMTPEEQELFDQLQKEIEELKKLLAKRDLDAITRKLEDTEEKASRLQSLISSRHSTESRPNENEAYIDRSIGRHGKSNQSRLARDRPRQTQPPDYSLESRYEDPRLQRAASDLARAQEEIESLHEILRDKDKLLHKEIKSNDKTQNTVAVQQEEIEELHQILAEQRDKMQDLEGMLESLNDRLPEQYHDYDEQLQMLRQGTSTVQSALQHQRPRIHNLGTPPRSREGVYTDRGGNPTARRGFPEEYEPDGLDYPDDRDGRVFTERGGYPVAHGGFPEEYEHEGRDPLRSGDDYMGIQDGRTAERDVWVSQDPYLEAERYPHYPEDRYVDPQSAAHILRPTPLRRPVPTFYPPASAAPHQLPQSQAYSATYQPQTGGMVSGQPWVPPTTQSAPLPPHGAVIPGGHPYNPTGGTTMGTAGFGGVGPDITTFGPSGYVPPGGAGSTTAPAFAPGTLGNVPMPGANITPGGMIPNSVPTMMPGGTTIPSSILPNVATTGTTVSNTSAPIQVPGGVLIPVSGGMVSTVPTTPERHRTAGFNSVPTTPVAGSTVGGLLSVPTTPVGQMSQPVMVSTPVGMKGILKKGSEHNDSEELICTVPEHHDLEDYIAQLQAKVRALKKAVHSKSKQHEEEESSENSRDDDDSRQVLFEDDVVKHERKAVKRLKAELNDRRSELEGLDLAIERQKASLEHMKETEKVLRTEREAAKKELKALRESSQEGPRASIDIKDKKTRRKDFLNGKPALDIFESDYEYEYNPHSRETRRDWLLDEIDCLEETLAKRRAELREGDRLLHETEEDLIDAKKEASEMIRLYDNAKDDYSQTLADAKEIETRSQEAGMQLILAEEQLASMHTEIKELEDLKKQQQEMLDDIEKVIKAKDEDFKSLDNNVKQATESLQRLQLDLAQAEMQAQERTQRMVESETLVAEKRKELELLQQQMNNQRVDLEVVDREIGKRQAELKLTEDTLDKRRQQLEMLDEEVEHEITRRRMDLQDIENHVKDLHEEKQKMEIEMEETSEKLKQVQEALDHEEAVLQNLATTTNKHKSELLLVDEELNLKQAALAQKQAQLSRTEALLESTDSMKLEEERELRRALKEHTQQKTELGQLQESVELSHEELDAVRGQQRTMEATVGTMHRERSTMEESHRGMEKRVKQLRRLQGQSEEAVQSLQSRKEQLESELRGMETDLGNLKQERLSLKEDLQELKTEIRGKKDELDGVQDELQDAEDDLHNLQEQVKKAQATLFRAQTELGSIEAQLEKVSTETKFLQREMERKKYTGDRLEELERTVKELEHKLELQDQEKEKLTEALDKSCKQAEKKDELAEKEQQEAHERLEQLNMETDSLTQELNDSKLEIVQLRQKYSNEIADLEGIAQAHYSRANRLGNELNYLQAEFLDCKRQLQSQQEMTERERKLEDTLLQIKSDIRNEVSGSIIDLDRSRADALQELDALHDQKDNIENHLDTLQNTLSVIRSTNLSDNLRVPSVRPISEDDPFIQQQLFLKQQLWQKMQQHAATMQSQQQLSAENLSKLTQKLSHLEQVMSNSDSGRMTSTSVSDIMTSPIRSTHYRDSCLGSDEPLTTQDLVIPDNTSMKPKRAYSPNRHSQNRRKMGSTESLIPEKGPTS